MTMKRVLLFSLAGSATAFGGAGAFGVSSFGDAYSYDMKPMCFDDYDWTSELNPGWSCMDYDAYCEENDCKTDCVDERDVGLNTACCVCGGGETFDYDNYDYAASYATDSYGYNFDAYATDSYGDNFDAYATDNYAGKGKAGKGKEKKPKEAKKPAKPEGPIKCKPTAKPNGYATSAELVAMEASGCTIYDGDLRFSDVTGPVLLTHITEVGGIASRSNDNVNFTSVTMPNLKTIRGHLSIVLSKHLENIILPSLEKTGIVQIILLPKLEQVHLKSLKEYTFVNDAFHALKHGVEFKVSKYLNLEEGSDGKKFKWADPPKRIVTVV